MRDFIIKSVLFLFSLFISILFGILLINSFHEFLFDVSYKKIEFEEAFVKGNFDIVAIGNSKLQASIDKEILENELGLKAAILGYQASNISISRLTLESYLNKSKIKPKIVLLEVSWFTFNKNRTYFYDISGDLFLRDLGMFKHYNRYKPEIRSAIVNRSTKQLLAKILPDNKRHASKKIRKKTPNTKNYTFVISEFENVFPEHLAGIDKFLLEDFYAIVKLCKNENIELILYTAPEDEDYSRLQLDRIEIKDIYKNCNDGFKNVLYLDYTLGSTLWKKEYELWLQDSHHINESDLFTMVLASDIKKYRNTQN